MRTWLAILVGFILALAFLCGLVTALYLVFPPPARTILVMGQAGDGVDSLILVEVDPARLFVRSIGLEPTRVDSATYDYVIWLDYAGFVKLVDAVGGVKIYVERVIEDKNYPADDGIGVQTIRFESGWQTMNGQRALIYARTVNTTTPEDRIKRQQQIVSAFGERLKDPRTWPAVLLNLSIALETDLSLWDMLMLAPPFVVMGGRFEQLERY
jgi:hypothetical protein